MERNKKRLDLIYDKYERVVKHKPYVYYGYDNLLPNEIIYNVQGSAKTSSILDNLSKIIQGAGINTDSLDKDTINFLSNNYDNDDMEIILEKVSLDLLYFGGFSLNVLWSKDGSKISRVSHIPFQKVRIKRQDDLKSPERYLVSADWCDYREEINYVEVAGFDPENKEELSQILYVCRYTPGMDYYPLPAWMGAYDYVKVDKEISDYQLNCALESYTPTMLINMSTGIPSPEEQERIAKELDFKFKGSKGSKTIITFSDGKDTAPEVNTINQMESDNKYLNIEKMVLDNILIACSIPNPNLVGIRTPGQLSASDEIIDSFLLLQEGFISGYQKIIEKNFNKLNYFSNPNNNDLSLIKIDPYPIEQILKKQQQ